MKNSSEHLKKTLLAVIAAAVVQGIAVADDETEVIGDRPDFTESVTTVGLNRVQLESGYTFASTVNAKSQNFPEVLLRYGVTDNIELRIVAGDVINMRASGTQAWERSDASLGFKYLMYKRPNSAWGFSLLGALSAPTGTDNETSKAYDPEIKLAWKRGIAEELDISGNINWGSESDAVSKTRHNVFGASISIGYELMERTGMFFEVFSIDKGTDNGGRGDSINAGLVYKVWPNLLVDGRVGVTSFKAGNETFAGMGMVYQIGGK